MRCRLHERADSARVNLATQQANAQEAAQKAAKERKEMEAEQRHNRVSEREREQQLELIRQQYLGKEKTKRKVAKASEKFRFVFAPHSVFPKRSLRLNTQILARKLKYR